MMRYNIKYGKKSIKYLKKLDKNTQLRILKAINELPSGDVKKLQGSTENYRLRVGNFRVIFSRKEEKLTIFIIKIGARGQVYDKFR